MVAANEGVLSVKFASWERKPGNVNQDFILKGWILSFTLPNINMLREKSTSKLLRIT